jgi:hypothetical protein
VIVKGPFKKKYITLFGGGEFAKVSRDIQKSVKKCHVLFEWHLTFLLTNFTAIFFGLKRTLKCLFNLPHIILIMCCRRAYFVCCEQGKVLQKTMLLGSNHEIKLNHSWRLQQSLSYSPVFDFSSILFQVKVPIMVSLLVVVTCLGLGAVMFSAWEDWELGSSLYFCFISLATIGFGDLVPINTFIHYNDGFGPMMKMIASLLYIVVGNYFTICVD